MTKTETGRIIKGVGGLYTVLVGDEAYSMNARGAFRKNGISPLPGDIVECTLPENADDTGVICRICERKNCLIRPSCANVDKLFIVACSSSPKADTYMLDKLSAVAYKNSIDVCFIFNKSDLCYPSDLKSIYEKTPFPVFCVSVQDVDGYKEEFESIKAMMQGNVNFFAGASGVGKSSLISTLFPNLNLEVGSLSRKISRGKHTTRATELYKVDSNTFIADTPGFSMLDASTLKLITMPELLPSFPDIEKFSHECRYRDCTHTKEGIDDCSVAFALDSGNISLSRHQSYVTLRDEIKNINEWEM